MKNKRSEVAQAIDRNFGQGDVAYGGNIVDAVYDGLKRVANSVTGCEYSRGKQDVDGHSLCQSIDKLAAAMNRIADVLAENANADANADAVMKARADLAKSGVTLQTHEDGSVTTWEPMPEPNPMKHYTDIAALIREIDAGVYEVKRLIPLGERWHHLQMNADKLKRAGLDEAGIYDGLKHFCLTRCEDGANYPDEKLRNLAEWAADDDTAVPTNLTESLVTSE
jgi:hypothetical protein